MPEDVLIAAVTLAILAASTLMTLRDEPANQQIQDQVRRSDH